MFPIFHILSFFPPTLSRSTLNTGRERNDQIGRAAVAPLFMRISVALSVILLHLICVLKEKGDRQGAEGRGLDELRGREGQKTTGQREEVIMKRQGNSDVY